jgi:cation-transporting ATPase 13A2
LKSQKITRDEIEYDLTFLGFLIMQNKLKVVTKHVIETLNQANIRTIMATGDNVLTAISVGR